MVRREGRSWRVGADLTVDDTVVLLWVSVRICLALTCVTGNGRYDALG